MTPDALTQEPDSRRTRLGDHDLRTALVRFVRHRLPGTDAEDIVQDTLIDALAASRAPEDSVELRRWVFGIARRKVADRAWEARNRPMAARDADGAVLPRGEVDAVDLVRWARDEVKGSPDDLRTLGWMVREGVLGETLHTIATDAGLPASQVRQRVSRLRRWLRERWLTQAAAAAVAVVLVLVWWGASQRPAPQEATTDDAVVAVDGAAEGERLRREAQDACDARQWVRCEKALDRARIRDPKGEARPLVVRLRALLERVLRPDPRPAPPVIEPAPAPSVTPTTSSKPGLPSPAAPREAAGCPCLEQDPMCGCLPGMGRSVVDPDASR